MEEIKIGYNKGNVLPIARGVLLFIAMGVWFVMEAESFERRSPEVIRFVGFASLLIGVMGVLIIGQRLFDNRPRLVLNAEGIHPKYNGVIPWYLVAGCDVYEYDLNGAKMEFLMIRVAHPEQLINKASLFRKLTMRSNLKLYGTPVCFPASDLKCSVEEIVQLITQYMEYYQSQGNTAPVTEGKHL